MSIRSQLLLPIGLIFLLSFFVFIIYLIFDQKSEKNTELKEKIENTSQLVAMTNIANLWNLDKEGIEQNLSSFLKDKEIINIEIKDNQDASVLKKEKEKKENLISKKVDIVRENNKIGSAEIVFTDYYINKDIRGMATQLIIMGIILFGLMSVFLLVVTNYITRPISRLTRTASRIADGNMGLQASVDGPGEIVTLAKAFNSMTAQLRNKAEGFKKTNEILTEIISKAKDIIVNLNSSSKEIEAAAQEQTSAASEQASGITQVSATLEELTITAKQITKNVGELVYSSEEVRKLLEESEKQVLQTVSHLEDVGKISTKNASEIGELGKRSIIINEMVELIKEVANKTDMLSINASIEAAKSKESGAGFSVIATEIRDLSKETIDSAKNVEKAAREIQNFLNSIIKSSEIESEKVIESGKVVKTIYDNVETIVGKINNNYSFTQKIDVSIKQQESGSRQAADTMKQMAEVARQSAETARQTSAAVRDIVNLGAELDEVVQRFKSKEDEEDRNEPGKRPEEDKKIRGTAARAGEERPELQELPDDRQNNIAGFLHPIFQKVRDMSRLFSGYTGSSKKV